MTIKKFGQWTIEFHNGEFTVYRGNHIYSGRVSGDSIQWGYEMGAPTKAVQKIALGMI